MTDVGLHSAMEKIKMSAVAGYIRDALLFYRGDDGAGVLLVLKDVDEDTEEFTELKRGLRLLRSQLMREEPEEYEVELPAVGEGMWVNSENAFYRRVRREGVSVWA